MSNQNTASDGKAGVAELTNEGPIDLAQVLPAAHRAMISLEMAVASSGVPRSMYELVKLRASQINGCAHCIDMHYKDARAAGETEERLYMLNSWRESEVYSDEERAALALTEDITLISDHHVAAEVEAEARRLFDTVTYAALIYSIAAINTWNRLAIASHSPSGRYQPGDHDGR